MAETVNNNNHACKTTTRKRPKSSSCECHDGESLVFCCSQKRDEHTRICPGNNNKGTIVTFKKNRREEDYKVEAVKFNNTTQHYTCFCGTNVKSIHKHVVHCKHRFNNEVFNSSSGFFETIDPTIGSRLNDLLHKQVPKPYTVDGQQFETILDGTVTRNVHLSHLYSCLICDKVIRSKACLLTHLGTEGHRICLQQYGLRHSFPMRQNAVQDLEETILEAHHMLENSAFAGVCVIKGYRCSNCNLLSTSGQSLKKRHKSEAACTVLSNTECQIQAIPSLLGQGKWDYRLVPPAESSTTPTRPIMSGGEYLARWRQSGRGDATIQKNQYFDLSTFTKVIEAKNYHQFRRLVSGENYEDDANLDKLFNRSVKSLCERYIKIINDNISEVSNTLRGTLGNAHGDDRGKFYKRLQSNDSVEAYSKCLSKVIIFLYRLQSTVDTDSIRLNLCKDKLPYNAMNELKNGIDQFICHSNADEDEDQNRNFQQFCNTLPTRTSNVIDNDNTVVVEAVLSALRNLNSLLLALLSESYNMNESNISCPLWVFGALSQVESDDGKLRSIASVTPLIAKIQFALKGAVLLGSKNIIEERAVDNSIVEIPFGFPPERNVEYYTKFLGQRNINSAMNILIHEFTIAKRYEGSDVMDAKLTPTITNGKPDFDGYVINANGTEVTRMNIASNTAKLISDSRFLLRDLSFRKFNIPSLVLCKHDDPSNATDGHGFKEDELASIVLDELMARCNVDSSERIEYLESAKKLLMYLVTLLHVTSFACSRGTEIIEFQIENKMNILRNIYASYGTIVIVPSYNKRDSNTGEQTRTPRYLPPEVAVILYYYITLVRPSAHWASGGICRHPMLFVNPSTNILWTADDLRGFIVRTFAFNYSLKMTFAQFRHIHCAFTTKHLTIAGSEMHRSFVQSHDNKVHLSSGHGQSTVDKNYATLSSSINGFTVHELYFALISSQLYNQDFLSLWKTNADDNKKLNEPTGRLTAPHILIDAEDNRLSLANNNNALLTNTSDGHTHLLPNMSQQITTLNAKNVDDCNVITAMISVNPTYTSYKSEAQRDYLRYLYSSFKTTQKEDKLFVLPTNTGKSFGVFFLAKLISSSHSRIIFVSPTNALLEDIQGKCIDYDIPTVCVLDTITVEKITTNSLERIILTSCEFLNNECFKSKLNLLSSQKLIHSVFIDEAHLLPKWKSFRPKIADGVVSCISPLQCNMFYMTATLPLYLRDDLISIVDNISLSKNELRHPSLRTDIAILRLDCLIPSPSLNTQPYRHYTIEMANICNKVVNVVADFVAVGETLITNILIFVTQKDDIQYIKDALLSNEKINVGVYMSGVENEDLSERKHAIDLLKKSARPGDKNINVVICTTAFLSAWTRIFTSL
jgi:hypothetical protein